MKLCKIFDNHVTNPTTKNIFMKIKATQEKIDINFLVSLRISVTQKQECFSLLIFEAKNGIRQEK